MNCPNMTFFCWNFHIPQSIENFSIDTLENSLCKSRVSLEDIGERQAHSVPSHELQCGIG